MKQLRFSKYNSIIPLTEKYFLLYNSFTNMYLLLSPLLKNVIDEYSSERIKEKFPIFFKQLVDSECFVDHLTDETNLLKERIRSVDKNTTTYHLTINPTVNCNFKCWYCYEKHILKSKMNYNIINNTKQFISNVISKRKVEWFSLNFFGGEPLLYYWDVVLPIIEHYRDCLDMNKNILGRISFTTNGYLLNDKMIQSLKENHVHSFQITLDGAKEDHDNTRFPYKGGKSFDKIICNIKKLLINGFYVVLRLNYTRDNISRMEKIVPIFASLDNGVKSHLSVNFQRVWQDNDGPDSKNNTQKHIENCIELFEKANISTSHKYHNYVWNSCYADKKNEAVIHYNGDIYKCTARDFTKQNRSGYLSNAGKIIWDEKKQRLRQTIRFTRPICHSCRIAPICGGSCSQKHLEMINSETCLLGYDDSKKDKIILDKFTHDVVRGA